MVPDVSQEAILHVFDRLYDAEPLPAEIVAHELGVEEGVARERLADLTADGALTHAVTDGGEDYWWAELAPPLGEEFARDLEETEADELPVLDRGDTVSLDELREG